MLDKNRIHGFICDLTFFIPAFIEGLECYSGKITEDLENVFFSFLLSVLVASFVLSRLRVWTLKV